MRNIILIAACAFMASCADTRFYIVTRSIINETAIKSQGEQTVTNTPNTGDASVAAEKTTDFQASASQNGNATVKPQNTK